jgi:hypothetical protein
LKWSEAVTLATEYDIQNFTEVSVDVDPGGSAHAVAGSSEGVWYFTNAAGEWTSERVSTAPADGYDGPADIAVGADGQIAIAFIRFKSTVCGELGCGRDHPLGLFMVTGSAGAWSEPVKIVANADWRPDIALYDGEPFVAFEYQNATYLARAAGDGGPWQPAEIGDGSWPTLLFDSQGRVVVSYVTYDQDAEQDWRLHVASESADGSFTTMDGPGLDFFSWPVYWIATGPDDTLHLVGANNYWHFTEGEWGEPQAIFPAHTADSVLLAGGVAVSSDDRVIVVSEAQSDEDGSGLWYGLRSGAGFVDDVIWPHYVGGGEDGPQTTQAITVDDLGQVHVLFTKFDENGVNLMYSTASLGPAE